MSVRVLTGDVRAMLATLPDESVHCVVTSPPYWGLRCYGVDGQIGQEPTLGEHIEVIVEVFREVRRVLRKDGTVWLNYGDAYCSVGHKKSGSGYGTTGLAGGKAQVHYPLGRENDASDLGLKHKDLCMMPARVALALQADGWWIRSEIIWHKPNPMPESITDRPTSSHEKIYLLARSERYYFDAEAVKEACESGPSDIRKMVEAKPRIGGKHKDLEDPLAKASAATNIGQKRSVGSPEGRNIRNVWTIATAPFPDAHFATFPPALIEPCIKAGTSEKGCCPECGAPWVRKTERQDQGWDGSRYGERAVAATGGAKSGGTAKSTLGSNGGKLTGKMATVGWWPSCECQIFADDDEAAAWCAEQNGPSNPTPCTVLDPFGGAGTTGLVADRLKRNAILIELNPEYAAMARRRIEHDGGMFAEVSAQ